MVVVAAAAVVVSAVVVVLVVVVMSQEIMVLHKSACRNFCQLVHITCMQSDQFF
jgi:hypothetical protein